MFRCRICKDQTEITIVWDLGSHAITSRFPFMDEPDPVCVPMVLVRCEECGLVQLRDTVESSELYCHNYGYRSGINSTMTLHLNSIVDEITTRVCLTPGDIVLDIGSNDSTLLNFYPIWCKKIGIDPTGEQFKHYYSPETTLIPTFFSKDVYMEQFPDHKAKIITSICMFYDLPDPVQFARDIHDILTDDGIWVTEQSYILDMLKTNSFDTVCHEHLEYYAFKQIEIIASKADLKIIDVSLNTSNGGSFLITLSKMDSEMEINSLNLNYIRGLDAQITNDLFETFIANCELTKRKFNLFLELNKDKSIYLYGASTKGNTLLQYFNVDNKIIKAVAERNPEKYGRRTPRTNIPIISEAEMRANNPDILIVLPWHFRNEFLEREKVFLDNGGQIVFPLPYFEVVTVRKTVVITGGTGQIGSYLSELLLRKNYIVYNKKGDITDYDSINLLINTIRPDEVYNLAAETDTLTSFKNPVNTFQTNACGVLNICQSIVEVKKNIVLFQASSAEIYKDREKGVNNINEDLPLQIPVTPYCLGKSVAHQITEYYIHNHGLKIFEGIIFNTESPRRKDHYLIKKICNYLKYLKVLPSGRNIVKLKLGNINTSKDWIHAEDVAMAIYMIVLLSTKSETYVISGGISNKVEYVLEYAFGKMGFTPWQNYVEIDSHLLRTFEHQNEVLTGNNTKLRSLGWEPKYTLEQIIDEMLQ